MDNKKAFTLIELLIITAILTILATAIFFLVGSSRERARDNAAMSTMSNLRSSVQSCVVETAFPQSRLGANTASFPSICLYNPGSGLSPVPGYDNWPTLAGGWTLPGGEANLYCSIDSTNGSICNVAGIGTTCGFNKLLGKFCYRAFNENKVIWCTEGGCYKSES